MRSSMLTSGGRVSGTRSRHRIATRQAFNGGAACPPLDEEAVRAVARLVASAGEQQVLVPAARGGRQPHDTHAWVPAATADLADPAGPDAVTFNIVL